MSKTVSNPELIQGVSARSVNFTIGACAFLLPGVLILAGVLSSPYLGSGKFLVWGLASSLSHYYFFNGLTRNIFVGGLCAVGFLMLSYKGWGDTRGKDRFVGVFALFAACGIGLIPCERVVSGFPNERLHGVATLALFGLIAYMLWFRFTERTGDSSEKSSEAQKEFRNLVYRACSVLLVLDGLFFLLGPYTGLWAYVLVSEAVAMMLFGVGWLTKSRFVFGYGPEDGVWPKFGEGVGRRVIKRRTERKGGV